MNRFVELFAHIDKPNNWSGHIPDNIWLGVTAENQEMADQRIPELLKIPAGHFVSCEPLLGRIDLLSWLGKGLDWVIVGGENGPKAREMEPEWPPDIHNQALLAGVPFWFKGWGDWLPRHSKVYRFIAKHCLYGNLDGPRDLPEGVVHD